MASQAERMAVAMELTPDDLLAPYAVKHGDGLGRQYPHSEKPGEWRRRFAVDRGRITHSSFFRKQEKAQVYSPLATTKTPLSNRMSHAIEVGDLSRDVARSMRLNADLAEAVGRGHDLGHTAFEHEGEDGLKEWSQERGISFNHNLQSVRIVTLLEHYSSFYRGLNLNLETIEGLAAHDTSYDDSAPRSSDDRAPSLEAQIVSAADDISYSARDIDDGIHLGHLLEHDLRLYELYKEAEALARQGGGEVRSAIIFLLSKDLQDASQAKLENVSVCSLDDVYGANQPLIVHSKAMREKLNDLHKYLFGGMYRPLSKEPYVKAAREVMIHLCKYFDKHSSGEVEAYTKLAEEVGEAHPHKLGVRDYVASLTDRQAVNIAQEIGGISERTIKNITEILRL